MAKKTYPNKEESMPKVAEPAIAYGRDLEHREVPFSSDAARCDHLEESDRMSVDEYFDEVWSMVLKKHEEENVVVVDRIYPAKMIAK